MQARRPVGAGGQHVGLMCAGRAPGLRERIPQEVRQGGLRLAWSAALRYRLVEVGPGLLGKRLDARHVLAHVRTHTLVRQALGDARGPERRQARRERQQQALEPVGPEARREHGQGRLEHRSPARRPGEALRSRGLLAVVGRAGQPQEVQARERCIGHAELLEKRPEARRVDAVGLGESQFGHVLEVERGCPGLQGRQALAIAAIERRDGVQDPVLCRGQPAGRRRRSDGTVRMLGLAPALPGRAAHR